MIDWWWEIRHIDSKYKNSFWDAYDLLHKGPFLILVVAPDIFNTEIGHLVIKAAQQANPALTTVYRLTYGSLP